MNPVRTNGSLSALVGNRWFPPLLIVAIYLACILLVDARGEFPLNDDWAYTRSAFRLASGEGLKIDEWAAPSLVGQALYGGLLARWFGPHFLVLRVSTLVLSCGISILLYCTLLQLDIPLSTVWVAVLSWVFNPIQFCLSFTFMTEVPFLFFVFLGIFLFRRHAAAGRRLALAACGAAFGYAFLIRQTAILFIAAVMILLLASRNVTKLRDRMLRATTFALAAGSFIVLYQVWTARAGGGTPALQRKFDLLRHITVGQVAGNLFGILFYLSFMLAPLWVHLLPKLYRLTREYGVRNSAAILGLWAMIAVCGLWWFGEHSGPSDYLPAKAVHARMPFLLNILYDTGLGPVTLDPTYYGSPATPVHPELWLVVTALTAAGVVILGSLCTLGMPLIWKGRIPPVIRSMMQLALLSCLAVCAFEAIFSHREEGGLFDRHILTAALPLLLFVACIGRCPGTEGVRQARTQRVSRILPASLAALAVLSVLAWFGVSATHDYLAWNRVRWQIGGDLLRQGVDPLTVSGGFEFNAWHNYDTFRARGNIRKVYHWWYDDPEYLITMEPQERYTVRRRLEYRSWLHWRDMPVYLLQRIG